MLRVHFVAGENAANSRLLAGLAYVPFLLINVISILYILLGNKGGKYARFHALQALFLLLTWVMVGMALALLFWIPQSMEKMASFQQQIAASEGSTDTAPIAEALSDYYAGMLPIFAISFIPILLFLALAVTVATGRDVRIPLVRELASRFL